MQYKQVKIKMNNLEDIKGFNSLINQFNGEARLVKGKYQCDAKSLMGLLAIDIETPTVLMYDSEYEDELLKLVEKYIV